MIKLFAATLLSLFTINAFAQEPVISCIRESQNGKLNAVDIIQNSKHEFRVVSSEINSDGHGTPSNIQKLFAVGSERMNIRTFEISEYYSFKVDFNKTQVHGEAVWEATGYFSNKPEIKYACTRTE